MNLIRKHPTLTLLATLTLACLLLRLPSFRLEVWGHDESSQAAEAVLVAHGGLPYLNANTHRPPLQAFLQGSVFAAFGDYNMTATRVVHLLIVLKILWTICGLALRLAGHAGALAAGAFYLLLTTFPFPPGDLYSFHTEWMQSLCTILAMALLLGGRGAPSGFAAGICFALAVFAKQPAGLDLLAAFAWLAVRAWRRPDERGGILRQAASCIGGGVLVTGGMIGLYVAAGGISEFLYYFWTYNAKYYIPAITRGARLYAMRQGLVEIMAPFHIGALAMLGGLSCLLPGEDASQHRHRDRRLLIALWGVSSLGGALLSGRIFGHYYIPAYAPWAILAGLLVQRAWDAASAAPQETRQRWRQLLAAGVLLVVFVPHIAPLYDQTRRIANAPKFRHAPTIACGVYLRDTVGKEDSIFVWGWYPQMYVEAKRRPASRFTFCNFITGKVPGSPTPDEYVDLGQHASDALKQLMDDLEKNRPAAIVDTASAGLTGYAPYPIRRYAPLAEYLSLYYEEDKTFPLPTSSPDLPGLRVYLRKE